MESENAAPQHVEPKTQLQGLEGFFDTYLREKAPFQIPPRGREWIVKYGPWISLVLIILAAVVLIPLLAIVFGLTSIAVPAEVSAGVRTIDPLGYVSLALSLIALVMEAVAIPGLLKRKMSGWKLIYYATLLSTVASLLNVAILSAIISLVIGMYILFQIRSYYR